MICHYKKRVSLLFFFLFGGILYNSIQAQNLKTVVLKVKQDTWIDTRPAEINRNFEYDKKLEIRAQTYSGTPGIARSVVEFDFDSLSKKNAKVKSATLSLYYYPDSPTSHYQRGENAFEIRRVLTPWEAKVITWTNKNYTTTSGNMVVVPSSTTTSQSYPSIDVTNLVTDYLADSFSKGFEFKLVDETPQRTAFFCSSKHPNVSLHPTLTITYEPVGVSDLLPSDFFKVGYANHTLMIQPNDYQLNNRSVDLSLFNALGNQIIRKNAVLNESTGNSFDLSGIALGIYFLQVNIDDKVFRTKIFVN